MSATEGVFIVTGGAQGIGKAIAGKLLTEGQAVVVADNDREAGEEAVAELASLGSVCFVATDVSQEKDVENCVSRCLAQLGRLDGLVNNAGIAAPHNAPVEELTLSDWNRVISINLTGCFLMARYCAPHLRRSKGAIINIGSTRALQSEPNTEAYSASKGGVVALTHALAISLGPEVRVNCISPGWIDVSGWKKSSKRQSVRMSEADHRQHPTGRVGLPADIAAMAWFLLSDGADFITGQNFVVDGGMTKKMIYEE